MWKLKSMAMERLGHSASDVNKADWVDYFDNEFLPPDKS